MTAIAHVRPRLRGASHRVAFVAAVFLGAGLVLATGDLRSRAATAVYVTLLVGMFGVSATLHRGGWAPRTYAWLRRADHAMIFAFIAGTYTPLCLLGLPASSGTRLLGLAWLGAGLGMLRAMAWPHAPRAVSSLLYVAVGWLMVAYYPELRAALDPLSFWLIAAGGILFTVGAVFYALRWPNPWPKSFGFHEVFHVMVIIGCGCHFVVVARLALGR
jgi:hemolysin III